MDDSSTFAQKILFTHGNRSTSLQLTFNFQCISVDANTIFLQESHEYLQFKASHDPEPEPEFINYRSINIVYVSFHFQITHSKSVCSHLFSNIVNAHFHLVLSNFAMSIASSSDWTLKWELWPEIHGDLINFGVPAEAWPRKPPRIYHVYNLRRRGAWVQVLLAVRRFDVPRPLPEWDRGHGVHIRWDD